ncbi:hypothetical protein Tco_0360558 [Tanacetum coccineum]
MQIPAWMITDEMKLTEHYRMSPNPDKEVAESSAPRRSIVIHLRIPERRSTRLTPPAPVPTIDKADEMILQDTLQVSLVKHKSHEEQEARENVALVDEHLASEEIKKMVDGQENIVDDSSIPRNDESNIPGTRIDPRSDKESPKVEIAKEKEVEIAKEKEVEISKEKEVELTNVVIPINVNDEDEEITNEVYELKRREKGKIKLSELTDTPHTTSSSSSPHKKLAKTNRLLLLFKTKPTHFKRYKLLSRVTRTLWLLVCTSTGEKGLILERKKAKEETERLIAKAILQEHGNIQAQISTQIENAIANVIPSQVDASVRSYMPGHILHVHPAQSQTSSIPDQQYQLYLAMKADPQLKQQDMAIWLALHMKFERNTVPQTTCRTPAVRPRDQDDPHDDAHPEGENSNQEQDDDFDFWTDSYASDDDEIPKKQVSQDIMEEVSLTIDKAKLRKMDDEMLRQRCTSGDEHQYHIDQMKNFLKSDIVWESRKEIIKGNSRPEKIVLSLYKFPVVIFNDDDIEERTSRWVNKKQKEPGKPKEEVYSNSKIIQVVKTYWELGHEHKFITEIVARRANKYLVSITEPDYKNLNKNDIEDIYLLIMNGKERVHDFQLGIESYQQKVNLTAPTMTFPGIKDHEMFSIIYEPVHGIIYKNSKKEKRVMRHSEIHKFCDATLNRVLEGLKSYNNDIKYGYVQKDLTKDEAEYLKLFEEEIEERLKHRRQMRRWEMFVNGRPLGPRRERPE